MGLQKCPTPIGALEIDGLSGACLFIQNFMTSIYTCIYIKYTCIHNIYIHTHTCHNNV